MGWASGKKTLYKVNTTRLTKSQQEDFLRGYMKMDSRKLQKFKQQIGGSRLLDGSKTVTQKEFTKTLEKFDSKAKSKFGSFLKDMDKKYQVQQDEIKSANIKKTREMEMKKEMADEKVRELTKSGRDDSRSTSIYDRMKKKKEKNMSKEERRERTKMERGMRRRLEVTNIQKTDWQHAEKGKTTSAKAGFNKSVGKSGWGATPQEAGPAKSTEQQEASSENDTAVDIAKLKEESKKLPDLQI